MPSIEVPLVLVILMTLLAGAAGVALWLATVRHFRSLGQPARCARCGQPTPGIQGLACPNCGADLREVGIRPPARPMRRWVPPLIALTITALLLIAVGSFYRLVLWAM